VRRGEVWWANLAAPLGRRPVVLLSRDRAYEFLSSVTVAVVTRRVRGVPVEVTLGPEDGMRVPCAVNADNILTIPRRALNERITSLSLDKTDALDRAVKFALALP
jgi:mRNA interferase MazF